ncbi:MAG: hypothetical protein M3O35_01745 [Acidobacteriota bacterium]|nr:hypothetical protein [Acidobacteriota bacterium]
MSHLNNGATAPSNTVDPPTLQAASCTPSVKNIQDCHDKFPTGCSLSTKPSYDPYLNYMKDQVPADLKNPINLDENAISDLNARTPAQLSTHNHGEFAAELRELGEGGVKSVVAFLYFSKANPGESSNCQLPNQQDGDFHVLIGFDAAAAAGMKGQSSVPKALQRQVDENAIIVEMTPYVRQSQKHTGWTLANLQKHWGDQVRVTGQLMIDNEHNLKSANCALEIIPIPSTSKCWRNTVWELHPVMAFDICNKGASCSAASEDGWMSLDKMQ